MDSGLKYWNGTEVVPLVVYSQMGIDAAMVARIASIEGDVEYINKVIAGLQEYCGIEVQDNV